MSDVKVGDNVRMHAHGLHHSMREYNGVPAEVVEVSKFGTFYVLRHSSYARSFKFTAFREHFYKEL